MARPAGIEVFNFELNRLLVFQYIGSIKGG